MGARLTPLGVLGKWVLAPAALLALGYYVVGPRIGVLKVPGLKIPGVKHGYPASLAPNVANADTHTQSAPSVVVPPQTSASVIRPPDVDVSVKPADAVTPMEGSATPGSSGVADTPTPRRRHRHRKPRVDLSNSDSAENTAPPATTEPSPPPAPPATTPPSNDEGGSGGAAGTNPN